MVQVFKVYIDGKFSQYLMKSEVSLIRWYEGLKITLEAVEITREKYKILFDKK